MSFGEDIDKVLTRSLRVKQFTEESSGKELPTHPRPMTREEVLFLVKMNVEELMELLATVPSDKPSDFTPEAQTRLDLLQVVESARCPAKGKPATETEVIADQVDALVDIDYYNGNAACKVGMDVDAVFDVVHRDGNMSKKFPDGTFHRNDEGKVIKPPNWKEPDVLSVVQTWKLYGTW